MTILETLKSPEEEQTANGRFLIGYNNIEPVDKDSFHRFSEIFWISNIDILPSQHGMIYQGRPPLPGNKFITIFFNANTSVQGKYAWNVTETNNDSTRQEHFIEISPTKLSTKSASFDAQGRKKFDYSLGECSEDMLGLIFKIANSVVVQNSIVLLKEKMQKSEDDLANFAITAFHKYSKDKYQKMMTKKKDLAKKVGFSASTPYVW